MEIFSNPTHVEIIRGARALKDGHLVAFPTETVYGLGADAVNEKAVSRVYSVKARPTDHPLIVHISSIHRLEKWAIDIPEYAVKLAEKFWPGPMTLILKKRKIAKRFITGGQENVGVRVPSHPVALALLTQFEELGGLGVAAPSANRFGAVSPTTANAVMSEVGKFFSGKDLVFDGGQCSIGVESTIIDCTHNEPIELRPGAISLEMVNTLIASKIISDKNLKSIRASGVLSSHYSPKANVELGGVANLNDGFIAMANFHTPKGSIRLASPVNVEEYAQKLYESLRLGDSLNLKRIVVHPPEGPGLAAAVRDRLNKAAAKIL